MRKLNKQKSMLLVLTTLCLTMLLVTACGKKGDLYLPETKVPETKVPETKAPEKALTETDPDKTETEKKDQKESQE